MKGLKGTKVNSIVEGSCPVCQNESMYKEKNPYIVSKLFEMNEHCSSCGLKYNMEPSFFFGAMYVSYGLGIILAGLAFVLSYLVFDLDLIITYSIIVVEMILLLPIIIRLSRNIWINLFLKYKERNVQVS